MGCTALGPSALVSYLLAKMHAIGSNIVLFTDGSTNEGIGSNWDFDFWKRLGNAACQDGITINLIALVGDDCDVQTLSEMCAPTGGLVSNVPAEELDQAVADSLLQQTIASQIKVKVRLDHRFKLRNESDDLLSQDKSLFTRNFGNAFEPDITFTFEYELKSLAELATLKVPTLRLDRVCCAARNQLLWH